MNMKKKVNITLTPEGRQGLAIQAAQAGCRSISDYLEKIGKGEIQVDPESETKKS